MLLKKLFETHLEVSDLERSIAFYERLGLPLAKKFDTFAFFWIGDVNEHMLGLWQVKAGREVRRNHFAFEVELGFLLDEAHQYLADRGIKPYAAFGREPVEPIVHVWQPAASLYFADPDKNELEFIAVLHDEPCEPLGYTPYYSEWKQMQSERVSTQE